MHPVLALGAHFFFRSPAPFRLLLAGAGRAPLTSSAALDLGLRGTCRCRREARSVSGDDLPDELELEDCLVGVDMSSSECISVLYDGFRGCGEQMQSDAELGEFPRRRQRRYDMARPKLTAKVYQMAPAPLTRTCWPKLDEKNVTSVSSQ